MQAWFLNTPCKQTCDSFTYSSAIHSFFTKSAECEDCSENTREDVIRLRSFTEEMILKWTSKTPWRFKGAWGVGVPRKSRQGALLQVRWELGGQWDKADSMCCWERVRSEEMAPRDNASKGHKGSQSEGEGNVGRKRKGIHSEMAEIFYMWAFLDSMSVDCLYGLISMET